jgi:hypothetical protein
MLPNGLLEPPGEPVIDLLVRAAQDQGTADRFVAGDPGGMPALLTGQRVAAG